MGTMQWWTRHWNGKILTPIGKWLQPPVRLISQRVRSPEICHFHNSSMYFAAIDAIPYLGSRWPPGEYDTVPPTSWFISTRNFGTGASGRMAHTSLRFLLLVFSSVSGIKLKLSRINQTFLPPLSLFPRSFASVLHDQVCVQQPSILSPFFFGRMQM